MRSSHVSWTIDRAHCKHCCETVTYISLLLTLGRHVVMLRILLCSSVLLLSIVGTTQSLSCYECNSALNSACSTAEGIKQVTCKAPNAATCRKQYQKVEDDIIVVRGCSSVTEEQYIACKEIIGTHEIKATNCFCRGDGCNGGSHLTVSIVFTTVLVVFAKVLLL